MISYIVIGILLIVSGSCKGVMDTIQFHYDISIFNNVNHKQVFWDPKLSWRNKYKKNSRSPKFWGSTTIFVFVTDAWHLFQFLTYTLIFVSLGIALLVPNTISMWILLLLTLYRVLFGLGFTMMYNKILPKQ